jgi:hypothetical protein
MLKSDKKFQKMTKNAKNLQQILKFQKMTKNSENDKKLQKFQKMIRAWRNITACSSPLG